MLHILIALGWMALFLVGAVLHALPTPGDETSFESGDRLGLMFLACLLWLLAVEIAGFTHPDEVDTNWMWKGWIVFLWVAAFFRSGWSAVKYLNEKRS